MRYFVRVHVQMDGNTFATESADFTSYEAAMNHVELWRRRHKDRVVTWTGHWIAESTESA